MTAKTITKDEVSRHDGRDGTYWLVIDGEVYDATEFLASHPGGRQLELGAGRDATILFESCHPGHSLRRARKALARKTTHLGSLPAHEVEPYGDPAFFETVRRRVGELLQERGLHYHSRAWGVLLESALLMLLYFGAWAFRVFSDSMWVWYGAAFIGGVAMARMGFAMHSGNHAAVSRTAPKNVAVGLLMDVMGGSSVIWQAAHQYTHHGRPNVLGYDNDCQIATPLLRFHPDLPRRWWHRIQSTGLGIGMSAGLLKWILTDVSSARKGRVVHASLNMTRGEWIKMAVFKTQWLVLQIIVPIVVLGPLHGLLTTYLLLAVGAYYMEAIFIVNHLQRDLVPEDGVHWAIQQVQGTANWSSGSHWANFISGGLNHQVEHHLFPTMSIYLYPTISPVVRQTCEEFGLEYRDYRGFWTALAGTVGYLNELGRPEPSTTGRPASVT